MTGRRIKKLEVMRGQRVIVLDWIRGIMAVCIMMYHYISRSFSTLDSRTLLGRLGGIRSWYLLHSFRPQYVARI